MSPLVLALLAQLGAGSPDAGSGGEAVVEQVHVRLPAGGDPKLLDEAKGLIGVASGQRLSARAVRRSIERLMETGHFADVEVLAEDVPSKAAGGPAGLRILFDLTARRLIGALYVEGNVTLTDAEVLAPTRLTPRSEFFPERATAAQETVLEAYRRRGFREAKVAVRESEGEAGVDVGFIINEGLPTRLRGVVVAGDPGVPLPRLMHVLGLELDGVLDVGVVEAALERLRETLRAEQFYRARVGEAQVEEGGLLVLPVWPGPKIRFEVTGNSAFAASALLRVIAWDGSEALDQTVTDRFAVLLANFYRYRGFHRVRVTVTERPGPTPRSLVVAFAIEEGPQLVVRSVVFAGNQGIAADELRAVLAEVVRARTPGGASDVVHPVDDPLELEGRVRPPRFGSPPSPAPETVLVEAAYLEAAKAIGRLYRERGYAQASVELEQVDLGPTGATVRFSVDEGPQTLLRRVELRGAPAGFPEKVSARMEAGDPLSDRRLDQWRQALARELVRRGFMYGTVESEVRRDNDGAQADLIFNLAPGPLVTVGKIFVRGNQRTVESVIRSQLSLTEGEPLDREALYSSQRSLLGLGIFRSVEVRILAEETEDAVKDLVVEVRERPRGSWEPSLGYFFAEGVRVFLDAEFPNIAGRAINLQVRGRLFLFAVSGLAVSRQVDVSDLEVWETLGGQGNISASSRLPYDFGARIDLVTERLFRQSYRFTRLAAGPGVDWSRPFAIGWIDWTRPKLTLQVQYEAEWSRVTPVNNPSGVVFPLLRADHERLRFLFGTFALHTVRFAPTIDLRDDAVVPRKGLLLQAVAETTLPLDTHDEKNDPVPVQFVKLSSTLTTYLPWQRFVLALSARAGTILPLTRGSVTPPVKRFFLGGSASLRGFKEDGLIAEDQRQSYRKQVTDCKVLATQIGCTGAAVTLLQRNDVPSQGGEVFALGKAELRFPAFGAFDVGVFLEAGNLWLAPPTGFSLRPVLGSGLRYVTPIGPIALDIGVNLAPDPVVNEPAFNVHFNIGLF